MIGEIGGSAEEDAADFIKRSKVKKPMVGLHRRRHRACRAAAWVMPAPSSQGGKGGADSKIEAMKSALAFACRRIRRRWAPRLCGIALRPNKPPPNRHHTGP